VQGKKGALKKHSLAKRYLLDLEDSLRPRTEAQPREPRVRKMKARQLEGKGNHHLSDPQTGGMGLTLRPTIGGGTDAIARKERGRIWYSGEINIYSVQGAFRSSPDLKTKPLVNLAWEGKKRRRWRRRGLRFLGLKRQG